PKPMCTYSLATEPGMASDHKPLAIKSIPNTSRLHIAACDVSSRSTESAVMTPRTTAAQSCQRVHCFAICDHLHQPRPPQSAIMRLIGRPVNTLRTDRSHSLGAVVFDIPIGNLCVIGYPRPGGSV